MPWQMYCVNGPVLPCELRIPMHFRAGNCRPWPQTSGEYTIRWCNISSGSQVRNHFRAVFLHLQQLAKPSIKLRFSQGRDICITSPRDSAGMLDISLLFSAKILQWTKKASRSSHCLMCGDQRPVQTRFFSVSCTFLRKTNNSLGSIWARKKLKFGLALIIHSKLQQMLDATSPMALGAPSLILFSLYWTKKDRIDKRH